MPASPVRPPHKFPLPQSDPCGGRAGHGVWGGLFGMGISMLPERWWSPPPPHPPTGHAGKYLCPDFAGRREGISFLRPPAARPPGINPFAAPRDGCRGGRGALLVPPTPAQPARGAAGQGAGWGTGAAVATDGASVAVLVMARGMPTAVLMLLGGTARFVPAPPCWAPPVRCQAGPVGTGKWGKSVPAPPSCCVIPSRGPLQHRQRPRAWERSGGHGAVCPRMFIGNLQM